MPSNTTAAHWDELFAADSFFYGLQPGAVARRAEKYHSAFVTSCSTALDLGCGEGQDLAFLAASGYEATGLDFSAAAVRKAQTMLANRRLNAQVLEADLANWEPSQTYDLVLSINALPFMGERADLALAQALRAVSLDGVIGLSVWAREDAGSPSLVDGVRLWTREEILAAVEASGAWQKLEVASLWQFRPSQSEVPCEEARPFVTIVAQRLK